MAPLLVAFVARGRYYQMTRPVELMAVFTAERWIISPELDFMVLYLEHHEKDIGFRSIRRIRAVSPLDTPMASSLLLGKSCRFQNVYNA